MFCSEFLPGVVNVLFGSFVRLSSSLFGDFVPVQNVLFGTVVRDTSCFVRVLFAALKTVHKICSDLVKFCSGMTFGR